ncbi:MAG: hypothetical protein ACE5HS_14215 [bacterium]
MHEVEYLFGIIVLVIGFHIGYRESLKGLTTEDFKKLFKIIRRKLGY